MIDFPSSPETETLAAKLEGRAQFHDRNCKGGYSYFSDTDGDLMVQAAKLLRSSVLAQCSKEPTAYLHTLHMELGQTQRKLMWTEPSPFGIPGKHYDATYTVSCTPLFAVTYTSTERK